MRQSQTTSFAVFTIFHKLISTSLALIERVSERESVCVRERMEKEKVIYTRERKRERVRERER